VNHQGLKTFLVPALGVSVGRRVWVAEGYLAIRLEGRPSTTTWATFIIQSNVAKSSPPYDVAFFPSPAGRKLCPFGLRARPKSLAAGSGATIKRAPMNIDCMPITSDATNQKNTEFGAR